MIVLWLTKIRIQDNPSLSYALHYAKTNKMKIIIYYTYQGLTHNLEQEYFAYKSLEELQKVPGIGKEMSEKIYSELI